jgi:hypothetical protein
VIIAFRHGRSQSAALAKLEAATTRNTLKQIRFMSVLLCQSGTRAFCSNGDHTIFRETGEEAVK